MKTRFTMVIAVIFLTACTLGPIGKVPERSVTYRELCEENPITVLILPPENLSNDPSATISFYATLFTPLVNAGYYVVPPLATLRLLQQERLDSTYLHENPAYLGEIFGADLILYTSLLKWEKTFYIDSGEIAVEADYTILSGKTGRTLFSRRTHAHCAVTTRIEDSGVLTFVASTVRTASIRMERVAIACSKSTFFDLPRGPYSPQHGKDLHLDSGSGFMFLKWGGN